MALQDPTASAKPNYEASTLVNVHLLAALKGEVFCSADHKAVSREVRSELKTRKKAKDDSELKSILSHYRAISAGLWKEARRQVNGSLLCHRRVNGTSRLKSIETLSFSLREMS
jgi:hypothetical protein